LRVQGRTGACILVGPGLDQGTLERDLGERGDSAGDIGERSPLLDVEHHQPLQHEMTRHAQRRGQRPTVTQQLVDQCRDRTRVGNPAGQQRQR
jgi:hypothetical protein